MYRAVSCHPASVPRLTAASVELNGGVEFGLDVVRAEHPAVERHIAKLVGDRVKAGTLDKGDDVFAVAFLQPVQQPRLDLVVDQHANIHQPAHHFVAAFRRGQLAAFQRHRNELAVLVAHAYTQPLTHYGGAVVMQPPVNADRRVQRLEHGVAWIARPFASPYLATETFVAQVVSDQWAAGGDLSYLRIALAELSGFGRPSCRLLLLPPLFSLGDFLGDAYLRLLQRAERHAGRLGDLFPQRFEMDVTQPFETAAMDDVLDLFRRVVGLQRPRRSQQVVEDARAPVVLGSLRRRVFGLPLGLVVAVFGLPLCLFECVVWALFIGHGFIPPRGRICGWPG